MARAGPGQGRFAIGGADDDNGLFGAFGESKEKKSDRCSHAAESSCFLIYIKPTTAQAPFIDMNSQSFEQDHSRDALIAKSRATFEQHHQGEPSLRVIAPGRINIIGEHIDYLDGCVLPMAIEPCLVVHAGPSDFEGVRITSDQFASPGAHTIAFSELVRREAAEERWLNFVIGVLAVYRDEGIVPPGFCLHLVSSIPVGAGLSSSAALETAIAIAIEQFAGVELDATRRARLCQAAEHNYAGVPCGIMDQLAVGACQEGHAMLLDCRDCSMQQIAIPESLAFVVADTEVSHAHEDSEYTARRQQCQRAAAQLGIASFRELSPNDLANTLAQLDDPLLQSRVRHVVTEMERVAQLAAALSTGDLSAVGCIMAAGHDSLRDDFEVSCREADCLVDAARAFGPERGLIGARMTGGGFGGATVHLVRREFAAAFMDHLVASFQQTFGRTIRPFVTLPAAGARFEWLTSTGSNQ